MGTRAVQQSLIQSFPDIDIWIGIVWIKMNSKDTLAPALEAAQKFNDPRVEQFYDPLQKSGSLLADQLPIKAGIAWDIYLFYEKEKLWETRLPDPVDWMHQMSDSDPDSSNLRCGDDLAKSLYDAMASITGSNPAL